MRIICQKLTFCPDQSAKFSLRLEFQPRWLGQETYDNSVSCTVYDLTS